MQHTALNQSDAEHLLAGMWQSQMMQLSFENNDGSGTVRMSGPQKHPGWTMDYTLHLVDDQWWLKLQDNNGERNYIVKSLSAQTLEIADPSGMTISFEKVITNNQ